MARVVVAMSGGVDSSVTAVLLREQGYDVIGMSMNVWDYDRCAADTANGKSCCTPRDVEDARRVCERLDIPFYPLNFREAFRHEVVEPFISAYVAGRTPNPCVLCNTALKFDRLWRHAEAAGADWIATGHYARIVRDETGTRLWRAVDKAKDQTYFLFDLPRACRDHVLFPLGGLTKPEVRALADAHGLKNAQKPESQDICFVREGSYADLVAQDPRVAGIGRGELVDEAGRVLGTHEGYYRYTIGQRRGLGVAFGERRFVLGVDPVRNRVVVGPEAHLFSRELTVSGLAWFRPMATGSRIGCQLRSRHVPQAARLEALDGGMAESGRLRVVFDEPQRAVTPGQAAVFYDGEECVGGGWIDEVGCGECD